MSKSGCLQRFFTVASLTCCAVFLVNSHAIQEKFGENGDWSFTQLGGEPEHYYQDPSPTTPTVKNNKTPTKPKVSPKTVESTPVEPNFGEPNSNGFIDALSGVNPNDKFKNDREVVQFAKKACSTYLTYPKVCSTLHISVDRNKHLEGLVAGETASTIVNNDAIKVGAVFFNKNILEYSKKQAAWVVYHELSHVEAMMLHPHMSEYSEMQRRAQKQLTATVDGVTWEPTLDQATELFTDCLVYGKAKQGYSYPGYSSYLSYSPEIRKTHSLDRACGQWKWVLYGGQKLPPVK